jgi:hypothetical protein
VTRALTLPYALSLLVVELLVVTSVAGLLYGQQGLYTPDPATLPAFLGQDAITLALGLPLLLGSVWAARRGSVRGLLGSTLVLNTWLVTLWGRPPDPMVPFYGTIGLGGLALALLYLRCIRDSASAAPKEARGPGEEARVAPVAPAAGYPARAA